MKFQIARIKPTYLEKLIQLGAIIINITGHSNCHYQAFSNHCSPTILTPHRMQAPAFIIVIVVLIIANAAAFRWMPLARPMFSLKMSDNDKEAQWDVLRAKYQANPNYDPMADPEAQAVLENLIPTEFRDMTNAIERLRVALVDATTGTDAIEDIDNVLSQFNKDELISSPQSKWFSEGRKDPDVPFSQEKLDELTEQAKKQYPAVPMD